MTEAPVRLGARYATPSRWQVATLVDAWAESPSARTLVLEVPAWPGHLAGQHVDLRLTAPDGYTAERSYSIGSAATRTPLPDDDPSPGGPPTVPQDGTVPDGVAPARVEVTVQRVPGGEVSTYLTDAFAVGDAIELRGPVGGWFVWSPERDAGTPVLLAAGGSGLVPLMAMLRTRRDAGDRTPFRLVYSVRRPEDMLYVEDLDRLAAGNAVALLRGNLLGSHAEQEEVLVTDPLADFDIGTIERADCQRAIERQFHIAGAGRFHASC